MQKLFFAYLLLATTVLHAQSVGIGTITPNGSAKLDVNSSTQGFLPPRVTSAQRDAIASPALGLVIYNITTNCLEIFRGTSWYNVCNGGSFVSGKTNKLLGGTGYEMPYSIDQTTDGGYIIAGTSNSSANGDVTGTSHGGYDYWVIKTDGTGNILWNK